MVDESGDLWATCTDVLDTMQGPHRRLTAWRVGLIALCPSLLHWDKKSWMNRTVSVISVPALLVLRLTVPVINLDECVMHEALHKVRMLLDQDSVSDDDREALRDEAGAVAALQAPVVHTYERVAADHFLQSVQCTLVPLFWLHKVDAPAWLVAVAGAAGTVPSRAVWTWFRGSEARDDPAHLQSWWLVRSLLGFVAGMVWIVTTVDQLLALLRAVGYEFHWSDTLVGLTVFALGNTLGDIVTNLSIARLGHPLMAFTACFAAPMTNMMLGVGFSTTWLALQGGDVAPYKIPLTPTLLLSISALLTLLVLLLVVVPLNQFHVSRTLGLVHWATYALVMGGSMMLEMRGA